MSVRHAPAFIVLMAITGPVVAQEAVELKPVDRTGDTTRVLLEMKADGFYLHGTVPSSPDTTKSTKSSPAEPKKFALDVALRLDFTDKVAQVGRDGLAVRTARKMTQAATAINGQVKSSSSSLRPAVSLLVAELRPERGLVVCSPGGPLQRSELEVVQGPCDPLLLGALLPGRAVKIGDSWNLGNDAAKCLSGYDSLATNGLVAKLASADDSYAECTFEGAIHGAVLGGEGSMKCEGSFRFDRKARRISSLKVVREEKRKPSRIEAGLDVKSTISVARTACDVPAELSDEFLAKISLEGGPERELLTYRSPKSTFSLIHDRDWHLDFDSDRAVVLKRIDRGGDLVSQCNLLTGPNLGKGKHQDPKQFREDIRKALGERFVGILGEGEIEGAPESGYRYKVTVQGRQGDVDVIWYYYLIASPEGDHLLVTFTLGQAQRKLFGNQDLQLIGSLEWLKPTP